MEHVQTLNKEVKIIGKNSEIWTDIEQEITEDRCKFVVVKLEASLDWQKHKQC